MEKSDRPDIVMGDIDMIKEKYAVSLVAPDGLGFGEGSISAEAVEGSIKAIVAEAITADTDQIIVDVEAGDDGCGDGRDVAHVYDNTRSYERSLHRSKVFGGSAVMASSALIGLGEAQGDDKLNDVFKSGIGLLMERGIDFGAHTDNHAHGENCGCGAIDKAPEILKNIAVYREEITSVINVLTGGDYNKEHLDEVMDAFVQYGAKIDPEDYSGKQVKDEIVGKGKIIKELDGGHKEIFIIINTIYGKTVDQSHIRELTKDSAQVFAVDLWRVEDIARQSFDGAEAQSKAKMSMLAYTLGTAGTLTTGDLPVYTISEASQLVKTA